MVSGLSDKLNSFGVKYARVRNKRALSKFLNGRGKQSIRVRTDTGYLINDLSGRADVRSFIKDPYREGHLQRRVEALEHTFVQRDFDREHGEISYTEDSFNILSMSNSQLLRVYLILEALQTEGFCNHVGALLEEAALDEFSEHGGIMVFDNSWLALQNLPSELAKERKKENQGRYRFPASYGEVARIARYHFHINGMPGPSPHKNQDLGSCRKEIIKEGESHHFVISKIGGGMFNIDYYGGPRKDSLLYTNEFSVVDLGNYKYSQASKSE